MKSDAMCRVIRLAAVTVLGAGFVLCVPAGASEDSPEGIAGTERSVGEGDISSQPKVSVEAILVELGSGAAAKIAKVVGFRLDPVGEQLVLTRQQREKLLTAVRESPGARIVASSGARVAAGKEVQLHLRGELLHLIKRDSQAAADAGAEKEASKAPGGEPSKGKAEEPEGKKLVAGVKVKPTVMDSRIALVATVEVSVVVGSKKIEHTDLTEPVLSTSMKTTSVVLRDGSSLLLKEPLLKAILASRVAEQAPKNGEISPQKKEMLKKLDTVVPEIQVQDAGLKEVVEYVSREAGINIIIDPVVSEPSDGGITIRLQNAPLKDVLRHLLHQKKLKYIAEDIAIVIVPEDYGPSEPLLSEVVRFLPDGAEIERVPGGVGPSVPGGRRPRDSREPSQPDPRNAEAIKDSLLESGVPWPQGSRVVYDADTGTLIVTNTASNMGIIRVLLHEALPSWFRPENQQTLLTIVSVTSAERK